MCWCSRFEDAAKTVQSVCASTQNFLTPVGNVAVRGPKRDHQYACLRDKACVMTDFLGYNLANGDGVIVLSRSGAGATTGHDCARQSGEALSDNEPSGFPNSRRLVLSDVSGDGQTGQLTSWGATVVTALPNTYSLCWAMHDWSASSTDDYRMYAGELSIVTVTAGTFVCAVNAPCLISGVSGTGTVAGNPALGINGDTVLVRPAGTVCGSAPGVVVTGFPNDGKSLGAEDNGQSYSWGRAYTARVTASPGEYQLCWCPSAYTSAETIFRFFRFMVSFVLGCVLHISAHHLAVSFLVSKRMWQLFHLSSILRSLRTRGQVRLRIGRAFCR